MLDAKMTSVLPSMLVRCIAAIAWLQQPLSSLHPAVGIILDVFSCQPARSRTRSPRTQNSPSLIIPPSTTRSPLPRPGRLSSQPTSTRPLLLHILFLFTSSPLRLFVSLSSLTSHISLPIPCHHAHHLAAPKPTQPDGHGPAPLQVQSSTL
jgi:hypothetical protein